MDKHELFTLIGDLTKDSEIKVSAQALVILSNYDKTKLSDFVNWWIDTRLSIVGGDVLNYIAMLENTGKRNYNELKGSDDNGNNISAVKN